MAESADALDLGSSPVRGGGSNPPFRIKTECRSIVLKSEITKSEGLVREVTIEIDAERVNDEFAKIFEEYRKKAKIKGFRPGKAPMNVIRQKFSESAREDVLEKLVEESYPKALKENEIKAATHPSFPKIEIEEGKQLVYTARLEVMPEIETVKYDGLKLPEEKINVQDTEVDTVVEFLRKKHSTLRKVDREIKDEDVIKADLTAVEDDAAVLDEKEYKDMEIDLGSDVIVEDFKKVLPGHKVGDEVEIPVKYPEQYGNANLAGKSIKYKAKITEVNERVLPEPNDAFSKTVGETETYLELRLKIREDLTKQKKFDTDKYNRNEIQRQFIDNNQIEIPEGMVQTYLERSYEEQQKQNPGLEKDVFLNSYRHIAENGLRWNLLTNRIAEDEKIEVSTKDTEIWIKSFADNYNMTLDQAKEALSKAGRIQEVRDSIMDAKIIDHIMKKVTYVPEEEMKAEQDNNTTEENK